MTDNTEEFRKALFESQEMSPALRASYQEELDRMLNPKLTPHSAVVGFVLLVLLLICTLGIVRNMFVYDPDPLTLLGWAVLAAAFSYASILIIRDLWLRKHSPKSAFSIAHALTFAAGTITVVALLIGLQKPSDPASTFNVLYVFVFYVACVEWSTQSRIAAAELAAREQMLRIECRLADIGARLPK
jgi:uncharacterized PurR-regulated membrane protein YhhQ (DUF165 family)